MQLEWTGAMSIGVAEIDAQHRELFRRAARFVEGLGRGDAGDVDELVDYLHSYVVTHFGAEEAAMRAAKYPGYASHKAEHDQFIAELLEIAAEHDARGGVSVAVRVDEFLAGWLPAHVCGTDAEMGRFLARGKG